MKHLHEGMLRVSGEYADRGRGLVRFVLGYYPRLILGMLLASWPIHQVSGDQD